MTNTQKKIREWFRRRKWHVYDNNGGLGTFYAEGPCRNNYDGIYASDLSIAFDYHAFSSKMIRVNIFGRLKNRNGQEQEIDISVPISREELQQIIALANVCDMELECSRKQ